MASGLLIAILAAGASQRLGRPKQLVRLHGEPLLRRQCRIAREARIGDVAAILGCEADRCAAALAGLSVTVRVNDQWREGLASSIRTATAWAISEKSLGLLLLHGDQYRLTARDLQKIGAVWTANPALACRARHEDYAGPPVILPAALFDDASTLTGDQGARQLLARLGAGQLTDVEMPGAVYDLDLPAQLSEFDDSPSDIG